MYTGAGQVDVIYVVVNVIIMKCTSLYKRYVSYFQFKIF